MPPNHWHCWPKKDKLPLRTLRHWMTSKHLVENICKTYQPGTNTVLVSVQPECCVMKKCMWARHVRHSDRISTCASTYTTEETWRAQHSDPQTLNGVGVKGLVGESRSKSLLWLSPSYREKTITLEDNTQKDIKDTCQGSPLLFDNKFRDRSSD